LGLGVQLSHLRHEARRVAAEIALGEGVKVCGAHGPIVAALADTDARAVAAGDRTFFIPSFAPDMHTKPCLNHADVTTILSAARDEALRNQWAVSIAVVDDGGHLLGLYRLDGAAPMSARMAPAKARTSALGRRETLAYEDMINKGRTAFLSAPDLDGMLEGGVPIVAGGQVVGAVGVSGVKSSEDAQIARAGIAALAA
jgi:glc operon protein GlcG